MKSMRELFETAGHNDVINFLKKNDIQLKI